MPEPNLEVPALPPGDRFLRLPQVLSLVGLGPSAWKDLVFRGRAPARIKIGKATVWQESRVRAWMAERIAESRRVA